MDVDGCVLSLHEFENRFYWYMSWYTLPPLNEHQSFVQHKQEVVKLAKEIESSQY